jgi:arylsulfatase A-like enzyme
MNVIVILADSLRVDHLGCYGNDWIKTPNLDRFAREATVFERAYSEGLPTLPTRTAMFTGRYTFPFRGWQPLQPNDAPIAEILWSCGYKSALITDTYHMHKPGMCYERGFDFVQFIRGQEGDPLVPMKKKPRGMPRGYKWNGKDTAVRDQMRQYNLNTAHWESDEDHFVAQVVKAGLRYLESEKERDGIFLWLDCFDPHEPWDPPAPFNRMYDPGYKSPIITQPIPGPVKGYLNPAEVRNIQAQYAGEVTLVDKWIGIFLDRVRELGMFDNSLIIFTTDHGEPLGEGKWGHGIMRKARPWPYEELSHIPLIIRHPRGRGQGKRVKGFAQTCDVAPTVLGFLGLPVPPVMQGRSLMPMVTGVVPKMRDFAVSGFYLRSWSIRTDTHSYILWLPDTPQVKKTMPGTLGAISCTLVGTLETPKKPELYDIRKDPYELNSIVDKEPEIAEELELKLRRFVSVLR